MRKCERKVGCRAGIEAAAQPTGVPLQRKCVRAAGIYDALGMWMGPVTVPVKAVRMIESMFPAAEYATVYCAARCVNLLLRRLEAWPVA